MQLGIMGDRVPRAGNGRLGTCWRPKARHPGSMMATRVYLVGQQSRGGHT